MKSEPELLELIRRYIDGNADEEDRKTLQEELRREPSARRLYARYANIDATLGSGGIHLKEARQRPAHIVWLQWRPLAAAAAGLLVGLFSASLVYGFVAQRHSSVQALLSEGFENAEMTHDHGVPSRVDVWSGDLLAPQEATGKVKPAEGLRMAALPAVEKRKFSYAFRFLDASAFPPMSGAQSRQIEVSARFHGAMPGVQDRFQIRLAAFAEDAAGAREIWVRDHVDELALLHVAKTMKMAPADRGWATVRAAMDVPAGTKVVLISLAAAVADFETSKTAHYLDDVQVRLTTRETPQP